MFVNIDSQTSRFSTFENVERGTRLPGKFQTYIGKLLISGELVQKASTDVDFPVIRGVGTLETH